jgi:cell wall-associated NlpC family hydrolase
MRAPSIAVLAVAAALLGCGSEEGARLPKDALVARAWAGREPSAPQVAVEVVAFAAAQVGKPYCWGGTGPRCFDCSGLAQAAWRRVGVHLPRTTRDIAEQLPQVPLDQVRAGDILWWPGHVGIYAGQGWVVDALDSGHGVVRRPATDPQRAYRPLAG